MNLGRHPKVIPNTLPTLSYLEKHCISDGQKSEHRFWRETRANHTFSPDGQAILRWSVRAKIATHMVSRGSYNVVRALRQLHGLPVDRIRNLCGLPQCVNHLHWG